MKCQNKRCINKDIPTLHFLGIRKIDYMNEIRKGIQCKLCPERKFGTSPDMKFLDLYANR